MDEGSERKNRVGTQADKLVKAGDAYNLTNGKKETKTLRRGNTGDLQTRTFWKKRLLEGQPGKKNFQHDELDA